MFIYIYIYIYIYILASLFLCVRIDVINFVLVTTGANISEDCTLGYQDGDFQYVSII